MMGVNAKAFVHSFVRCLVRHRWFVLSSVICTVAFVWLITDGSFALIYRAFAEQYFRRVLVALAVALVPMALVLFYGSGFFSTIHGDFVPALVIAAGIGLAVNDIRTWRAWLQISAMPFALTSVFVTFALALHYQGEEVWGVPDSAKSHYRHIKQWFDEHL
jgi:hypothetical protein